MGVKMEDRPDKVFNRVLHHFLVPCPETLNPTSTPRQQHTQLCAPDVAARSPHERPSELFLWQEGVM